MEEVKSNEMSFFQHLEDLRWHIIRSLIAVCLFTIIAFIFSRFLFDDIILAPRNPDFITNQYLCELSVKWNTPVLCINQVPFTIINISMAGQFNMHILVSLIAGIILAFPYLIFELWRFIAPALYDKERRAASGFIIFTSLLFFIGILFGFFIVVPLSVHFLGNYTVSADVINQISLGSYISSVATVTLASGLVFELPLVILLLTKLGIVTPSFLSKFRRHSYLGILIVAAIITPPDIFSMTLVTLPLILLYEISIFISASVMRKKNKQTA